MQNRHDSLTRSTLLLTGVGIISQVLGFFYRVVLSRLIGAETMGLYQLIMPVYSVIMSITISGLTVALSTLSASSYASGNQKAATQLLLCALRGLVLLWMPIAAAVCLFSRSLAAQVLGDARTRLGLLLLLPVLLLTGVENLNKHHFYGIGETRLPAAVEIGEQFIRTAAILGLLALLLPLSQAHTVAVIVLGMVVSEIFSSTTLTLLRRRREGPYRTQSGHVEPPALVRRRIAAVALPVSTAALLNNLIASASAVLIPQKLQTFGLPAPQAMELYGIVFGMALPLLMLPSAFVNALSLALVPRLTRCAALHRAAELNRKTSKALQATSLIVLPVLALLVPLGGDVGALLFREERVGQYLLPLALAVALSSWESVLAAVLNSVGRQSLSAGISLLCGALELGFVFVGVERFGFGAFVLGMILSSALGLLLRLRGVRRATGLQIDGFSLFAAPTLAALLSGLCVNLLYRCLLQNGSPTGAALCSCVAAGALIDLAALLALGCSSPREAAARQRP